MRVTRWARPSCGLRWGHVDAAAVYLSVGPERVIADHCEAVISRNLQEIKPINPTFLQMQIITPPD